MSLPNIPDITPEIKLKRSDVIHLLLASIAMEEMSLSHIMNAEGEKIQKVLKHDPCIADILEINRSTERMLRNVIKQQMLLQFKMEDVLVYGRMEHKHKRRVPEDGEKDEDYEVGAMEQEINEDDIENGIDDEDIENNIDDIENSIANEDIENNADNIENRIDDDDLN